MKQQRAWPLRTAVITVALVLAALQAPVQAQGDGCKTIRECLSKSHNARWDALDKQITLRAQQYRELLQLHEQATRSGNSALLARIEPALRQAKENWDYIDAVARQLEDDFFTKTLTARSVRLDEEIASVQAELHKRTEIFDRLRNANEEERASLVRQMQGLAIEEKNDRLKLALDSAGALGSQASRIAGWLGEQGAKAPALASGEIGKKFSDQLTKLAGLSKRIEGSAKSLAEPNREIVFAVKGAKAGYKAHQRDYYAASIEAAQIAADIAAKALATSEQGVKQLPALATVPTTAKLVLNFVSIIQDHHQFAEVEQRFANVESEEMHWRIEIALAGGRLESLRQDRALADEALQREASFKRNILAARETLRR